MDKIVRYADVELRSAEDADGTVQGLAIVFNREADLGWFYEQIDERALDGANMDDVVLNFNHNNDVILARTTNGSLVLDRRSDGVYMTSKIVNTSQGQDIKTLVREGLINKMSFAFTIDGRDGEKWETDAQGKEHRTITKIDRLYDVSLVTFPAYPQTSAWARSNNDELAENHKALMERRAEQDKRMKELLHE